MRAYVGYAGLQSFVAEGVLPDAMLRKLVRGWASATATVVSDDDGADGIRRDLLADRPDAACGALLNRAVELIPLRPDARDSQAPSYPPSADFSR